MGKSRKTDMVILGLLEHENLSGYDIKKRIDSGISFFWKESFGSIYPSLNAMEKEGLIVRVNDRESVGKRKNDRESVSKRGNDRESVSKRKNDQESVSKREKFLYAITESGKNRLAAWLKDPKAANDLKYETLLKLFFGGAAGPETAIRTIEQFERETSSELRMLKEYQGNLSGSLDQSEDHLYFYLTVTFGVETCEGYLRWCEKAKQMLGKEN